MGPIGADCSESLANAPGRLLLHFVLQIAARHCQADRVAEYMLVGPHGCRALLPMADEFDFVMQVLGPGWDRRWFPSARPPTATTASAEEEKGGSRR